MKKLFKEFRDFITKGNVVDLAVGVIIGAAFKDIVTSLTSNILQPILDLIVKTDFGAKLHLKGDIYLNYGAFITSVINFIIMAFVIFLIVKLLAKATEMGKKLRKHTDEAEQPVIVTTKICPFCKSEIDREATRCPHCTSVLAEQPSGGQESAT